MTTERLLRRIINEVLGDEQITCRCGRTILVGNWPNHTKRKDGKPHRIKDSDRGDLASLIAARLAVTEPVLDRERLAQALDAASEKWGWSTEPHPFDFMAEGIAAEYDRLAREQVPA